MDTDPYYTLRGGRMLPYRPKKLPSTFPSIDAVVNLESDSRPPAQRAFVMVTNHTRWLECLEACKSADELTPHPTCRNQEQSRFIAISQPSAGALFNISPDGTFATTVMDLHFEIAAQRRGGLHISSAEPGSTI